MVEYRDRDKIKYSKNLFGMLFIAVGAILIIEHIYMWGELSFWDFIGHEWGGLILIIIGIVMNLNFKTPLSSELVKLKEKFK
jgi:hypothetical protein